MQPKTPVIVKRVAELREFTAADDTLLREVLHPANDNLALPFSLAYAKLTLGEASLPHRLTSSETYYFLQGRGQMFVEDEMHLVGKDSMVHVPAGALQHVENIGIEELIFLCVVAPAWSAEGDQLG